MVSSVVLYGLDDNASSGSLKFMGGIPELRRRRFLWCRSRWCAGDDSGVVLSACLSGVEGDPADVVEAAKDLGDI